MNKEQYRVVVDKLNEQNMSIEQFLSLDTGVQANVIRDLFPGDEYPDLSPLSFLEEIKSYQNVSQEKPKNKQSSRSESQKNGKIQGPGVYEYREYTGDIAVGDEIAFFHDYPGIEYWSDGSRYLEVKHPISKGKIVGVFPSMFLVNDKQLPPVGHGEIVFRRNIVEVLR